jgi:outer membrane immunogenic protein
MAQEAGPGSGFTGVRAEGLVGYDETLTYGGALGFDFQSGRAVLGVEGEYLESEDEECGPTVVPVGGQVCAFVGRDLYLGGRIGVAIAPNTLLYGKAGYTNIRIGAFLDGGTGGGNNLLFSEELDGVRVGAGVEQKLGRNAFIKGEYRYSNYEAGQRKHDGVVGIGFRF